MPLHSAPYAFFVSGRIHPGIFYCQPATEIRSNDKKLFLTCEKTHGAIQLRRTAVSCLLKPE